MPRLRGGGILRLRCYCRAGPTQRVSRYREIVVEPNGASRFFDVGALAPTNIFNRFSGVPADDTEDGRSGNHRAVGGALPGRLRPLPIKGQLQVRLPAASTANDCLLGLPQRCLKFGATLAVRAA